MSETLLDYVLASTPNPLQASSIAVLTFLATNNRPTAVTLKGISIKIPIGPAASELATGSEQITQAAPNTQWKHNEPKLETGFVSFVFVPVAQKPFTLQPKDELTFVLANIPVNNKPGSAEITVTEGSNESNPTTILGISKFPPGWGTVSFSAIPANINAGGNVTLSWNGPAGATYSIQYIDEHEKIVSIPVDGQPPLGNQGSYPGPGQPDLSLAHTTAFTLSVAYTDPNTKSTYHTQQQQIVAVASAAPEITSFTAEMDYSSGEPILLLDWEATNANYVEGSWTSELLAANPEVKTPIHPPFAAAYTITALSGGVRSQPKGIQLDWPEIKSFTVELKDDDTGKPVLQLNWQTDTEKTEYVEGSWTSPNAHLDANPTKPIPILPPFTATSYTITAVGKYGLRIEKTIDIKFFWKKLADIQVGENPGALACSLDGAYVFVSDRDDEKNTLSVIEIKTLKKKKTVTIEGGAYSEYLSMALTQDYIFLINNGFDNMMVINIKTDESRSLELASSAKFGKGIAISPTGSYGIAACQTIFGVDNWHDNLQVFDAQKPEFTHRISLQSYTNGLFSLGISLGNSFGLVANHNGTATVVDCEKWNVISTKNMGAVLSSSAISPDSSYALVADWKRNNVSMINIRSLQVDHTIDVGQNPCAIVISPNNFDAFVVNESDKTVSVIDIKTRTITQTIPVGLNPQSIAISPNGCFVFVANYDDSTVSVLRMQVD
ncbi:YncE family protein [Undibacterium sp. Ji83W]|uniref:YncE family protein n=1 Tax=Undibacterium sp. Ji83W TaxID=3413043 RepID=UPI003BF4121C